MFNAASVLPAGPAERDDQVFPLRERLRFRDNFGLALRDLRQRETFASLPRGPWQVFIGIATYWQANAEAWPSQETIASFTGYSSRAVRDYVSVLEQRGIVRTRRERRANGAERIFYAPGLVTLIELAAFVERFPRQLAKARAPEPVDVAEPPVTPSHPPEAASGAPPEATSMEQDHKFKEPSSSPESPGEEVPQDETRSEEQNAIEVTEEDREIARVALTERMKRKHPKRPPPRWFDAGELALVAACSSAIEGDREAKLQAHRNALAGAYLVSKDGPPTVRFIWEKIDHFFEHADRGRARALAEERAARRAESSGRGATARTPQPTISPAEMRESLERLFATLDGGTHVSR
ncbi:MAG: helix-turn-helix domain-containing protein [Labilithrix sp.]|nr:helix-turn-helix domain-containing protein [Labilithrix sp.]